MMAPRQPHSVETKAKISEALQGRTLSSTTKEKLRLARLGQHLTPETKAKIGKALSGYEKSLATREKLRRAGLGHRVTDETKAKMRAAKLGKKHTAEHNAKIGAAGIGRKAAPETLVRMRLAHKGEKGANYKGGISPFRSSLRTCFEYRQWRDAVFHRDSFTCQDCGQHGGELRAHHLKRFQAILDEYTITALEQALACIELWDVWNGITLCINCHKKRHQHTNIVGAQTED